MRHRTRILDRVRKTRLHAVYGLSDKKVAQILKVQNGVCAICQKTDNRKLVVDHDHRTGKVRGLLCSSCNTGLGCFKDDQEYLTSAIRYLSRNPSQQLRDKGGRKPIGGYA